MNLKIILLIIVLGFSFSGLYAIDVIRINQLGYLPNSIKVAVFISSENLEIVAFTVHNAISGEVVFTGKTEAKPAESWGMKTALRLDFSQLEKEGDYYLKVGKIHSPNFKINADVYEGTADFILNYLRQQRCGYNSYLKDSCHTHDGIVVDHPTKSGEFINVTGGWHDATDYLQYSTTSINTVYQMMFAFQHFPEIYDDYFDARGEKGSNQVPDILDEFKKTDPGFSKLIKQKALDAWKFALSDTGYCQTACNVSPYFYEESNFADDLELGAAQLFQLTGDQ